MRTYLSIAAAVVAIAVTGLVATGAPGSSRAALTIQLITTPKEAIRKVDKPPPGWSKGDLLGRRFTARNAVPQFGRPRGAIVGSLAELAVLSSPTAAVWALEAQLPDGTIRARGAFDVTKPTPSVFVTRVVGGTGRYAGASGTLESRTAGEPRGLVIFRLRLPGS